MPVIKIFYAETLDGAVRNHNHAIQDGMECMMREVLHADPAKCQVVFVPSTFVTPLPIYVDMQFRATEHRQGAVIERAMDKIAAILGEMLSTGIRIRAFAIDQSTLYARDVE